MPGQPRKAQDKGLSRIELSGFKSFIHGQSVEIRELTLLAGANSSGKSSLMQPLLLMKQTLEVGYDPGALLLDGPNVKLSDAEGIFARLGKKTVAETFVVGLEFAVHGRFQVSFSRHPAKAVEVSSVNVSAGEKTLRLQPEMSSQEILDQSDGGRGFIQFPGGKQPEVEYFVSRRRFLLGFAVRSTAEQLRFELPPFPLPALDRTERFLRSLIHLPGLRGNPSRTYPMTSVAQLYPGTFENYTASVIAHWQEEKAKGKLEELSEDLATLGLTWKVRANRLSDTQVALVVGRLPKAIVGGAWDLVNIADVGFGLSQTLPVLVALHAAGDGQTVYLEQPEIHLHPRAQVALAKVLARAVNRGVQVILETHSSLLLLALQALIAEGGALRPEQVKLHWFTRDAREGATVVKSADVDRTGSFGEWPEDFGKVELELENRYLSAVDALQKGP